MINASKLFAKGRPKNYLTDESIKRISTIYHNWKEENGISKVVAKGEVIRNDYNLSPSRYVAQNGTDEVLPLEESLVLLKEAEEESKEADENLKEALGMIGLRL